MKNLFIVFALVLMSAFAFASTGVVEFEEKAVVTANAEENAPEEDGEMGCFDFYDSCGGEWEVCSSGVSTWDLVEFLWDWDGGC